MAVSQMRPSPRLAIRLTAEDDAFDTDAFLRLVFDAPEREKRGAAFDLKYLPVAMVRVE